MRRATLLTLLSVAIVCIFAAATPRNKCDGISQKVVDNIVRFRRANGRGNMAVGSGSIVGETETHYLIDSNRHVTLGRGTVNRIDYWNNGKQRGTISAPVQDAWFKDKAAKDISTTMVPKSAFPGPMPVLPYAPRGYKPRVGQLVISGACSDGRWPRPRVGRIAFVEPGLIYCEPPSIGGDSGSGIYDETGKLIGRTAWYADRNGKRYCLAHTSDRVHDIKSNQTTADIQLPESAEMLALTLPSDAKSLAKASEIIGENEVAAYLRETGCENCNPSDDSVPWRNPDGDLVEPQDPAEPPSNPSGEQDQPEAVAPDNLELKILGPAAAAIAFLFLVMHIQNTWRPKGGL